MLLIFAAAVLVVFNQRDLDHTILASQALYEGHLSDFYSFNASRIGSSDYLIPIYLIFAAWIAPLNALGFMHSLDQNLQIIPNVWVGTWAQLLLVISAVFSISLLRRLTAYVSSSIQNVPPLAASPIHSPFVVFAIFFMGQYDIIWITLVLWALVSGLNNKYLFSGLLWGLAISVKYFAFPIVILYLIIFKIPKRHYASIVFLAIGPSAISLLAFASDENFLATIFELPLRLLGSSSFLLPVLAIGLLTMFEVNRRWGLFRKLRETNMPLDMLQVFVAGLSIFFGILFTAIRWNPQWLVVIPFIIAIYSIVGRVPKWYWWLESLAFACLVYLMFTIWSGNLDQTMFKQTAWEWLNTEQTHFATDFLPHGFGLFSLVVIQLWILSPIIIFVAGYFRESNSESGKWRNVRIAAVTLWVIPVMLSFSTAPTTQSERIYVEAINSSNIALGKYHSTLSSSTTSQVIKFDLPVTAKGITVDHWTNFGIPAAQMSVSVSRDGKKICSGNVITRQRSEDILWQQGWNTAYFVCPMRAEFDRIDLQSEKIFELWLDTKTIQKVRLELSPNANGIPVIGLLK